MQVPPGTKGALANKHGSVVPEGTLDFLVIEIPAPKALGAGLLSEEDTKHAPGETRDAPKSS